MVDERRGALCDMGYMRCRSSQRVFKIVLFGMPGVSRFGVRNICDDVTESEMM